MKFSPSRAVSTFVSTFHEWHYLIGGVAIGWTSALGLAWVTGCPA